MTDVMARLSATLADRYRLVRELGSGGMATVYLAHDLKHHRQVALKVLRPELARTVGPERFLREIETTANLRHPNILPLFDSGQTGDWVFYVMPFAEGETLRQRLDRETLLPVEDALQIAREITEALGYAHARGVIHRDIKPENILLESGHAVVADFGIARAVGAAGAETLTGTGFAVGTPGYMSPEQAAGDKDLDGRSDQYALACVLYEMLAGQPPFTGPTVDNVMYQHLAAEPRPITQLRPAVPPEVAAALQRALAKTPADRFNPLSRFAEALHAGALAAPIARPASHSREKSLAVLPFVTLPTDPDNEYFSDGITEEIINALVQVPGVHVSARSSCFAFKGKSLSIAEVAARLDVSAVLEGSVRRAGDQLRITAQLVDVRSDTPLWSERFDRRMDDVFRVQEEIAAAIVSRLEGSLGLHRHAIVKPPTENLEAYHMYLRGRHKWHQRGPHMYEALEWFQRAIDADHDFAQAHAGLADTLSLLGMWGYVGSDVVRARAKPAAERALALDESLADGHLALGLYEMYHGWDIRSAEYHLRRAAAARPTSGVDLAWLSQLLGLWGRVSEAIQIARQAQALEPFSPMVQMVTAPAHLAANQFQEVLDVTARSMALDEGYSAAMWARSWALTAIGNHAEAIRLLERAAELSQRAPIVLTTMAGAFHAAGQKSAAQAVVGELQALPESRRLGYQAWALLSTGQTDAAFEVLPSVYSEHRVLVYSLPVWPELRWLLHDERWAGFMESAGLADILAQQRRGYPTTRQSETRTGAGRRERGSSD